MTQVYTLYIGLIKREWEKFGGAKEKKWLARVSDWVPTNRELYTSMVKARSPSRDEFITRTTPQERAWILAEAAHRWSVKRAISNGTIDPNTVRIVRVFRSEETPFERWGITRENFLREFEWDGTDRKVKNRSWLIPTTFSRLHVPPDGIVLTYIMCEWEGTGSPQREDVIGMGTYNHKATEEVDNAITSATRIIREAKVKGEEEEKEKKRVKVVNGVQSIIDAVTEEFGPERSGDKEVFASQARLDALLLASDAMRGEMVARAGCMGYMYKLLEYHSITTASLYSGLPNAADAESHGATRAEIANHSEAWMAELAFIKQWAPFVDLSFEQLKASPKGRRILTRSGLLEISLSASKSYVAGAHCDSDATHTAGRVTWRGPWLQFDEQNFVLLDYSLIIPLRSRIRWAWRSVSDYHGTTLARCHLLHKDASRHKKDKRNSSKKEFVQRTIVHVVCDARLEIT